MKIKIIMSNNIVTGISSDAFPDNFDDIEVVCFDEGIDEKIYKDTYEYSVDVEKWEEEK